MKVDPQTKKKVETAIKLVTDLSELGLSIYNMIKLHSNYSYCDRYNEYSYVDTGSCKATEECDYYSERQLTQQEVIDNNCYLTVTHGYLKVDLNTSSSVIYVLITLLCIVTLTKIFYYFYQFILRRRSLIKILFFQFFLQFCLSMSQFIMSTADCRSICALMSTSNIQELALQIASAGCICLVLLFIYMLQRCFCSNNNSSSDCDKCFVLLSLFIGVVCFQVASSLIIATKKSIFGIELPLKIQIGIIIVQSLYGQYKLICGRKGSNNDYNSME